MYFVWMAMVMFGGVVLEVLLGNGGLSFPVTLLSGFYFAVTVPWRQALLPLAAAALAMECLRLDAVPVHLLSMACLTAAGNLARKYGDPGSLASRPLSGLAVCAAWLPWLLADLSWQGRAFTWRTGRMVVLQIVLLPPAFWILQSFLDLQAELLHFRKWTEVSRHDLRNLDKDDAA